MTAARLACSAQDQIHPLDPDTVLVIGCDPSRPHEWVVSIRRRQPDNQWIQDAVSGLRFEAHQFLPLVDALTKGTRIAPLTDLDALALRYRTEAESTGDPRDIRRARILRALAEAEAGPDDAEITKWERQADSYLRAKHGSTWASGSKVIRRPGVPPHAFHEMLKTVHDLCSRPEVELQDAARRANARDVRASTDTGVRPMDGFDVIAEALVLEFTNQLPEYFPTNVADACAAARSRVAAVLRTLRAESSLPDPLKYHSREELLRRTLHAAGIPAATIDDLFGHREKATSRRRLAHKNLSRSSRFR